jgi:hypothetical protein
MDPNSFIAREKAQKVTGGITPGATNFNGIGDFLTRYTRKNNNNFKKTMNNAKKTELLKIIKAGSKIYGEQAVNAALDIVARYNRFKKPQNVSNKLIRLAKGKRVGFSNKVTVRQRPHNTRVGSTNNTRQNVILSEANLEKTRISGLKSVGAVEFQTHLPPNEKNALRKSMKINIPTFSNKRVNSSNHSGSNRYNEEDLTAEQMAQRMLQEAGV